MRGPSGASPRWRPRCRKPLIPVIAIIGPILTGRPSTEATEEVGVGAILGAPFTLATLPCSSGLAVLIYARRSGASTDMSVNVEVMEPGRRLLLVAYGIAIGARSSRGAWRWADYLVVVLLTVIYIFYVRAHFRQGGTDEEPDLAQLHATRLPFLGGRRAVPP